MDSHKSPIGPTIPPNTPSTTQSTTVNSGKKPARAMNMPPTEPTMPPKNPSHVLFGLTSTYSLWRPRNRPAK